MLGCTLLIAGDLHVRGTVISVLFNVRVTINSIPETCFTNKFVNLIGINQIQCTSIPGSCNKQLSGLMLKVVVFIRLRSGSACFNRTEATMTQS